MERMERIENLNVRGFCTQGIVGGDGIIPMFIVWLLLAVYPRITRIGFVPGVITSLSRKAFSARFFVASSSKP